MPTQAALPIALLAGSLGLGLAALSACTGPTPASSEAFSGAALRTFPAEGVEIEVLREGMGIDAADGDWVAFHYAVLAGAGRVPIDTSREGQAKDLVIGHGNEWVKGVHLGLRGARKGELRRVFVPAKLAYGPRRVGDISANSDLVFELEIVSVEKGN